ncbi:hypothetical protein AB1Y20_016983 [Prymnesium parvum]|uniref:Uncharacterized protein n=1 Tax=Prymnesium parvum TaxID=97485 RepID=A0AB34I812_PRYPA
MTALNHALDKLQSGVTSLDLRENNIRDEGAAHIAEALKTTATLTSLNLGENEIGAEGAAHIAEALKTNATLTSLNLRGNDIGAEGAAHIAEALKTNATLTSLDLNENGIGSEALQQAAARIRENRKKAVARRWRLCRAVRVAVYWLELTFRPGGAAYRRSMAEVSSMSMELS